MEIYESYKIQILLGEVKKENNLEDVNHLKNRIVDHILWNLFAHCIPTPGKEEIVVMGRVMYDGKGDWFAMLNMCHQLQKKFPERIVRLVADGSSIHKGKLKAPKLKALDLTYDTMLDPRVQQKVKDAAVVVIGPVSLSHSLESEITKEIIAINEYDAQTNFAWTSRPKLTMGFGLDAMGIFTKSIKKEYRWQDVENKHLKEILFQDTNPSQEKIDNYLSKHEFFLGYMSDPSKLVRLIRDAAAFAPKIKSLDFLCPLKGDIKEIEENINLLKKHGISSVKIIFFDDDKKMEKIIFLNESGIEMRVIDVGLLSEKDFKILTRISAPLVGCTGDNSIALVLSYGKIPCYDLVGHKRFFLFKLLALIEHKFGKDSALFQYVQASSLDKNSAENSVKFVQQPELIEQAKELGKMIREYFSFNLKGIVNESLFRQTHSDFATKVDRIRQDFLDSKISVEEVEKQFTEELIAKKVL